MKLWLRFYSHAEPLDGWDICVHQHSHIGDLLHLDDVRGWHCVRHPKALIYSAALYHEKCSEPWVDIPLQRFDSGTFWATSHGPTYDLIRDPSVTIQRKSELMQNFQQTTQGPSFLHYDSGYELGGATYREFIQSLGTLEEKLLFEMKAYSRGVINDMLSFPDDKRFFRVKLEDVAFDSKMLTLKAAMSHLGFKGFGLSRALRVCRNFCLWKIGTEAIRGHATTGMSPKWRSAFVGRLNEEFEALYPHAESNLGYL